MIKQDFSDGYKHYYVIGEDTDLNKFYNVAKQKEYILDIDLDFLILRMILLSIEIL